MLSIEISTNLHTLQHSQLYVHFTKRINVSCTYYFLFDSDIWYYKR